MILHAQEPALAPVVEEPLRPSTEPPPSSSSPGLSPARQVLEVRGPVKRTERAEQIALFRYQLIREAADESLGPKARGIMIRDLAGQEHPWPFGGSKRFSRETLDRWVKAWKAEGFDGLKPAARA